MIYSLEQATPVLRQTPAVLDAMLSRLPEEWTRESEGPGSWTPIEVVGHLAFIEENDWIDRARVILEHGTDCVFEPIDREAGFQRFSGMSLAGVLEHFSTSRKSNLLLLDSLVDPDDLDRRGVHPDFGEVTLDQLLATWVVHDMNHIGQIVKTMAKQYAEAVGPWRTYLPIIDAQ
ncbi:MAG: DinB family protein [Acidimicrobiales bacterium]